MTTTAATAPTPGANKTMDSIRKKLQDLSKSAKTPKKMIWKPVAGEEGTVVRILPYVHGPDPFNVLYFHYDIAGKNAVCPSTFGKECPICDFASTLKEDKSKTRTKEEFDYIKKLYRKFRVYVPVFIRGKESEGPKFWGLSKTVYENLLTYFIDPEYGDMSHPVTGTDIKVIFTGPSSQFIFGKVDIYPSRKASALLEDKAQAQALIKSVSNINEIYPEVPFDELSKMLEEYLNPKSDKAEEAPEVTTVDETTFGQPSKVSSSLDSDFDDMFATK